MILAWDRVARPNDIAHLAQFIAENDYLNAGKIELDAGIRMQQPSTQ